ncbi:MAG: hypothetical protein IJX17_00875 [Clostridia bacterium]|nr:hypothetical protein [Clostridia bacterium]
MDNKEKLKDLDLSVLDEMISEHNKFKEYYNKKYEGISEEEKLKLQLEELKQVEEIVKLTNMKKEEIDINR